ncbi:MAG: peptidase U32 family protein, partial [Lutispora sp.]
MKIELLAPAGNFESLVAAVESGADAVYFGGTKYNARASANNFDEDTLAKAVRYAHIRNVKIYITVNILISDDEITDALEYIEFLYNNDVDGLIVQDLGLLFLIKRYFPDIPVHCSTQMTIHNKDGVAILKNLGADRFVLAREINIKEINNLVKDTNAEIEIFVHGALCVSYSGQCLMSSLIGGRSGNRGKCAQPCRKAYSIVNLDNDISSNSPNKTYLLSMKDLNTIERLDEIVKSGVKSLKIEGRMKRPEYVAIVVKHYKDV